MPVLKVDGVPFCQTAAIVNYASKISNLPKLSEMEQMRNRMVCETVQEVSEGLAMPAMMAMKAVAEDGNTRNFAQNTYYIYTRY